ncbi:hypothetical protein [Citricoccus nitrophenolicus]|uniref:hypothetical protein n=1 Tax=Citricoccus nitrophenolicus TaxID=863575 RepID=UPI0031ED1579
MAIDVGPDLSNGLNGYGNYLVLRATGAQHITGILQGAMDPDYDNDIRLDWLGDGELVGDLSRDYGYYSIQELMKDAGDVYIAVIARKPLEEWARSVADDYPELDIEFSWRYLGGERIVRSDEDGWERVQGVWSPMTDEGWAFREEHMGIGNRPLAGAERKAILSRERRMEHSLAREMARSEGKTAGN